jgi:thiamine-phosphate diphosphorylase
VTICLVTDRRQLSPEARTTRDEVIELGRWLEHVVAAGVDLIQIRERDLPARMLAELARSVMTAAAGSSTRVVVNDRVDVAIASHSDGVHLRGDGPPVGRLRELAARESWIIGRSIHSVEEARAHEGADYLLFGAVFDSGPKHGLGLQALSDAAAAYGNTGNPGHRAVAVGGVLAIGGITVRNAHACINAGASGVAAIRLFLPPGRAEGALGVTEACIQLRNRVDDAASSHLQ